MKAKIIITPKKAVLDPQGKTVARNMDHVGITGVQDVRIGKRIEIALEAAETGHLVFSTLHTIDASKSIDRIIGMYPKNEEKVIRTRLAQTFRYIVSQRLIPKADGKGRTDG